MGHRGPCAFPRQGSSWIAMGMNPVLKMCPDKTIEKRWFVRHFADLLPEEVAWRQKEQFSDGVGYSWIDTLEADYRICRQR